MVVIEDPRREIAPQLESANVNRTSYLATDYLNHFNEVVMLFEMVPDMPEIFEDIENWRPKTYAEHFDDSGFHMKDLVIRAYELSPPQFRRPFDAAVARMDDLIAQAVNNLRNGIDGGLQGPKLAATISELDREINNQFEKISALVNATGVVIEEEAEAAENIINVPSSLDQEAIDFLFDDQPSVSDDVAEMDAPKAKSETEIESVMKLDDATEGSSGGPDEEEPPHDGGEAAALMFARAIARRRTNALQR